MNSALHVGLLTSDLSHRHGWAHYSLDLLQALRQAGICVTVIASRSSPDVEGVQIHRLLPDVVPAERSSLLKMLSAAPQMAAVLRRCDVIHATIEPFAPVGAWVKGRRPLFVTAHGSYVPLLLRRRAGMIYRQGFSSAHIICVSHYTEKVVRSLLPGAATSVITHGMDTARFADLPPLETPRKHPTVLTVGAVKRRKGTLELVRAMADVRRRVPDAECVIIGNLNAEPEYSQQVRDAIQDLGLQESVHLLGHVPEATLLGWYGAADVFALPALNAGDKFEGYGLVYMEASAAGLPVIGTTDCGAEDAIIDGVTGLLLPQTDLTSALPDAIVRLLTNPAQAKAMGTAGRSHAQAHTWENTARQVIECYHRGLAW